MEEDNRLYGIIGVIITFSFISSIFLFISMLMIGGLNNYALQKVYSLLIDFINSGVVHSAFQTSADALTGMTDMLPYIDKLWFISFITLAIGSIVYSYNVNRNNFFGTLSLSIFGLIIFTYVGSIFITLTDWFTQEILYSVFPSISSELPLFTFYITNIGVINLILIVICIIVNFIDLDFSKFNKRKEGDVGEI